VNYREQNREISTIGRILPRVGKAFMLCYKSRGTELRVPTLVVLILLTLNIPITVFTEILRFFAKKFSILNRAICLFDKTL
jgi:hypothetical protein